MSDQLTLEEQATNFATMRHIERVRNLLGNAVRELMTRAENHDQSKLARPEVELFTLHTKTLAGLTYGSSEYKQALAAMKPALDHHYANNRHHPEFFRWRCPVCNGRFGAAEYEAAPQGPNDTGVRFCPDCSGPGVIYETELIDEPATGIEGMDLLDLVEMFCDWKAASERHNDGNILTSITKNADRFGLSPQLVRILENTAKRFDYK